MRSGRDAGAHVDDDGAAGVGEVSRPRPGGEGVLRVPPVRARAVGRPGGASPSPTACIAGASVDRNGLRPCRYKVRRDGLVVSGSEVGLVDLDPREVVECGKVGPGEVLVVDTRRGEVIRNLDAKREVAGRRPYARWVARYMATLVPDPARVPPVARRRRSSPARSGRSATGSRICGWCSSRWAAPAPIRSGAWATTRRSRRSRRCRRACTPTSASASPR